MLKLYWSDEGLENRKKEKKNGVKRLERSSTLFCTRRGDIKGRLGLRNERLKEWQETISRITLKFSSLPAAA